MAKKTAGKLGFKETNKAPLGLLQVELVQAIEALGAQAYGAEIERYLGDAGVSVDRGQVYQSCARMEKRGFLTSRDEPHPKRPKYPVWVYAVTAEGKAALALSLKIYGRMR